MLEAGIFRHALRVGFQRRLAAELPGAETDEHPAERLLDQILPKSGVRETEGTHTVANCAANFVGQDRIALEERPHILVGLDGSHPLPALLMRSVERCGIV